MSNVTGATDSGGLASTRSGLLERSRQRALHADAAVGEGRGAELPAVVALVRRAASCGRRVATAAVSGGIAVVAATAAVQGAVADMPVLRYGLSALNTVAVVALVLFALGRWVRIDPRTMRRVAAISGVLLAVIILTGAAVRLTDSGLGCVDWPTCSNGNLTPALSDWHGMVEFGNRIVTGLCVLAAGAGVLATLVRVPFRADLARLAVVVVVAILGNAVVGGLMVQRALPPSWVLSHFLLAIAALAAGVVLLQRSGETRPTSDLFGRSRVPRFGRESLIIGRVLTISALTTLFLGTLVTGSGPHAGDERAERLRFAMVDVARVHSGAAWVSLVCALVLAYRHGRGSAGRGLRTRLTLLLAVAVVQGCVGYVQWFLRVPAGLVFVHVVGAVCFWTSVLWVRALLTTPGLSSPTEAPGSTPATV